ncbi:UTRA domain-containing protein [Streptomyces sp. NPDC004610]|uniref:GntR family transcriptional regulator n=1 Tax=unclassified Streptomyces TaxID=2593676 RepID=UPI0033A3F0C1
MATGHLHTDGERTDILGADMVPAPDDAATALGVTPGDQVARRERVTFEGEQPTSVSCSWFTSAVAEVAPRLLQRERVREGTTRYVEMQTGRRPHTGRDWWTSRLATDRECELLTLQAPAAVAEVRHVSYDADGQPLAYEVAITPAGRWARTEEYAMAD